MEERNNTPFTDEDFEELVGGDPLKEAGREARGALMSNRGNEHQGVLRYTLNAHVNKDYRQELKLCNFGSSDEADDFVAALDECLRLGMSPTPIIDQAIARSAGVKHEFVRSVFDALTHQSHSIFTNYNKNMKPDSNQTKGHSPF